MVVYAYVGTYDNFSGDTIRGNGKTLAMTYYLKRDADEGKRILTNYTTTFSEAYSFREIVDMMKAEQVKNSSIGISEVQKDLNSLGTSSIAVNFVDDAVSQIRKFENDLHWDSQRWMSVNNRLRAHVDMIARPYKYHVDGTRCKIDRCIEPHLIAVYVVQPPIREPIKVLRAWVVGEWYNSKEVIYSSMGDLVKEKKKAKV